MNNFHWEYINNPQWVKIWIDRTSEMQHEKKRLTREEAITRLQKHIIGGNQQYAKEMIDFYIEAGMLEIVEEPYYDHKIIEALAKSQISASAVMMELDRAGFKIVEK